MQKTIGMTALVCILFCFAGCKAMGHSALAASGPPQAKEAEVSMQVAQHNGSESYTTDTNISDVINDPVFGDYGRLIFPVDNSYYSGDTLGELKLTWYNNIDPDTTVEITNYMKGRAQAGGMIFYDIYSDTEKAADPAKEDTGLFSSKGIPGSGLPSATPAVGLPM